VLTGRDSGEQELVGAAPTHNTDYFLHLFAVSMTFTSNHVIQIKRFKSWWQVLDCSQYLRRPERHTGLLKPYLNVNYKILEYLGRSVGRPRERWSGNTEKEQAGRW
jgi:hypothetical protein